MGQTPQTTVGTIHEVNKLARKATAWARTPLKILIILLLWLCTQVLDGPLAQMAPRKVEKTAGLHCKLRVAARQRIKHVSDILAFESNETSGKIFICSRDSSSGRRR